MMELPLELLCTDHFALLAELVLTGRYPAAHQVYRNGNAFPKMKF